MASEILLVNPRKRRKTRRKKSAAPARRKSAAPRRRRRTRTVSKRRSYRRNPSPRGIMQTVQPAVQGALGATLLSLAFGYIPLPATLKTGPFKHVVRAGGALALGMVASKVAKGATAKQMATGAMTVVLTDAIRDFGGRIPALKFGEYDYDQIGYYSPGEVVGTQEMLEPSMVGEYVEGMGEYVEGYGYDEM